MATGNQQAASDQTPVTVRPAKRLVRQCEGLQDADARTMLSGKTAMGCPVPCGPFPTLLSELALPSQLSFPAGKGKCHHSLCWQLQRVLRRGKSVFSAFLNTGKSFSCSGQLLLSHRILIVPRIQLLSFRWSSPRGRMHCDGISNLGGLEQKRTKP